MKRGRKGARLGRRGALSLFSAAAALAVLPGCTKEDLEKILASCPSDPADQGGIDWTPDVGAPVFYGHQDLTPADGAPRDLRIFYPSVDGSPQNAPLLKRCLVRWPLVLFLHGQGPNDLVGSLSYHLRWVNLPAVLARCGYVVAVPSLSSNQVITDPDAARDAALRDLDWVRDEWAEAEWVHPDLASTAVAGHSLGGVLAALVAGARPGIGALVTLSGDFFNGGRLRDVTAPSLFMWARDLFAEDLDSLAVWDRLEMPRYGAVFDGEHFDYLPAGNFPPPDRRQTPRGPCELIGPVAADLAALFLSIHVPVPLARHRATLQLDPSPTSLTDEQKFFAGGHLSGLSQFQADGACGLDLRWDLNGDVGTRQIGS